MAASRVPPPPPATHVRSSLIVSSLQALRARSHFDAYAQRLPALERDVLPNIAAGLWLPMGLAMTHYEACEALGLPAEEQVALGAAVSDRVQGSFLGLFLRAANGVGITPWIPLGAADRLWGRVFQGGGGVEIAQLGPKEATCRFRGLPIMDIPYVRNGWRGVFVAGMQPFCAKAYAVELPRERRPLGAMYRLSWA
jgi:hypothetical protein